MEYVDALKLKEEWGDKPCDHPVLVKEKYVGTFLVTWVCTTCGREFTIAEKMEMYQMREKILKDEKHQKKIGQNNIT